MIKLFQKALLTTLLLLWVSTPAYSSDAIAIWTEKVDNSYHVFVGELIDGKWQKKPRSIYTSKNHLTTATVGSDSNGNRLAIWSVSLKDRMILMESRFTGNEWSKPRPLGHSQGQNISATIVYDLVDTPWVFWVSDADGLSDIYMTRGKTNGWSSATKVNVKNEVPDISPLAGLDKNGNVVVTWQSFSFKSNTYENESHTFTSSVTTGQKTPIKRSEHLVKSESKEKVRELSITKVPYVTGVTRMSVHYPNNFQLQSEFLGSEQ